MNTAIFDPVCGRPVTSPRLDLSEEYAGVTYSFCSQDCLDRFIQDTDIFTLGELMGQTATRDRGRRGPSEFRTYAGTTTFEQSQT
jgi:YHS domain-containing protein